VQVCIYIALDAVGIGVLNQVLRAAGRVRVPGIINVVSFYAIGLPAGAYLAFGMPELGLGWARRRLPLRQRVTEYF
jgi:Na+-driven multidrug efflux pump